MFSYLRGNPKQIECFYGAVILAGYGVGISLPKVVRVVLNVEYCHAVPFVVYSDTL